MQGRHSSSREGDRGNLYGERTNQYTAGGGRPQEERVNITGNTGSGQDWMKEGGQIIERNMEDYNAAIERKRQSASVEKKGLGDLLSENTRKPPGGPAAPPQCSRPG